VGHGYETGRAFIEVEQNGKMLQRYWTPANVTQVQVHQSVNESMRGGFTVHITQVRENRAYFHSRVVEVPWSNKELDLSWEHFVSKLEPGQRETWTAVIKSGQPNDAAPKGNSVTLGASAERVAAEVVATLYDESLDQFRRQQWIKRLAIFRLENSFRRRISVTWPNRSTRSSRGPLMRWKCSGPIASSPAI